MKNQQKIVGVLSSVLLSGSFSVSAGNDLLEEVVVVSPIQGKSLFDANYSVSRVSELEIRRKSYRSLPQALRDVPGVMVQETAYGQGSPYIRGFTGFRNVFLIDGVRLNNSVFREGPNQYWATVDPFSLQRLEVISGPSSVLYGSDAIGGAVYAVSENPLNRGSNVESYTRLASAEKSWIQRVEGSAALSESSAIQFGVTGKEFGNLRGGDDVGLQKGVGYTEWMADIKYVAKVGDWQVDVLHQQLRQNNVPRTHRTQDAVSWEGTSIGSDIRRELDQERTLSYVRLSSDQQSWVDNLSVTASFATMEEVRDRVRSSGSREQQGVDVDTQGLQARVLEETALGSLSAGFDYYRDNVNSFSSRNSVQGPVADDADYSTFDIFIYDEIQIGAIELNGGVRHSSASADADRVSDPLSGEAISLKDDWSDTVFSLGVGYELKPEALRVFGGVSQGFRTPNLSDLTRFDTARSNEFEVPAPGLKPEQFVSYEIGMKFLSDSSELVLSLYHTDIDDMIIRFPTGRMIDGEYEITKDNIGDGFVRGVELQGQYRIGEKWKLGARMAWMESEVSTYPSSQQNLVDEPIDRELPFSAAFNLTYTVSSALWFQMQCESVATADNLSTRDQSDTSRIPPGGTPSYTVFHLNSGYQFSENVTMNLSVQNALNEDYRVHGSGTNMPGRNVILGLSVKL